MTEPTDRYTVEPASAGCPECGHGTYWSIAKPDGVLMGTDDGLYVSFDGQHICLRAPREHGDHFVVLEQLVYRALLQWVARYPVLWEHFATEQARKCPE